MKRRAFLKMVVGGMIGALLPASLITKLRANGVTFNAVPGSYVAAVHPSIAAEMWSKKFYEEAKKKSMFKGEVGQCGGMSIIKTGRGATRSSSSASTSRIN